MRILVTGATGFVGGRLAIELASGHEVFALHRGGAARELAPEVEWIEADLASELDRSRLPDRIDAVAHLAQSRRYAELPEGAGDVFAVNVRATFDLLEYARTAGASRFVLASSGGVYRRSAEPIKESDPAEANSLYEGSRLAAEQLAAGYGGELGTVVLRPFAIYGPGQSGMMIARLAAQVLAGEVCVVEGDPGLRINPVFIDDAVKAFSAALLGEATGTFNLAGPEVASVTSIVESIAELSEREPRVRYVPARAQGDLVADVSALEQALGVAPEVRLREGLMATVAAATLPRRNRPPLKPGGRRDSS